MLPVEIAKTYDRPYALVDVETTGLTTSRDRIVQVAIAQMEPNGVVTDQWSTLIDPERDPGPVAIHGITRARLRGAPRYADVAPRGAGAHPLRARDLATRQLPDRPALDQRRRQLHTPRLTVVPTDALQQKLRPLPPHVVHRLIDHGDSWPGDRRPVGVVERAQRDVLTDPQATLGEHVVCVQRDLGVGGDEHGWRVGAGELFLDYSSNRH